MSNFALNVNKNNTCNDWCLDSGCSSHLCNDYNVFNEITDTSSSKINLANHVSTIASAKGTVNLSMSNGAKINP